MCASRHPFLTDKPPKVPLPLLLCFSPFYVVVVSLSFFLLLLLLCLFVCLFGRCRYCCFLFFFYPETVQRLCRCLFCLPQLLQQLPPSSLPYNSTFSTSAGSSVSLRQYAIHSPSSSPLHSRQHVSTDTYIYIYIDI